MLSSFGTTTATGLAALLEGQVSHDRVTRFLSQASYDSKTLWQQVKATVRSIDQDDGVLIFDDTVQAKPHTDENELICGHYDHSQNRSVKGLNLLRCVYHAGAVSLPVAYELVCKPIRFCDVATRQVKRKGQVTKNQLLRLMLEVCRDNRLATGMSWLIAGLPPKTISPSSATLCTSISWLPSNLTGRSP